MIKNESRNSELVYKYTNSNKTLQELAGEYGLTRQRVHQILNRAGIQMNTRRFKRGKGIRKQARNETIVKTYKDEVARGKTSYESIKELASFYHLSLMHIRKIIVDAGELINTGNRVNIYRQQRDKEIIENYPTLSFGELTEKYHLSKARIIQIARAAGVKKRKRPLVVTEEVRKEIVDTYLKNELTTREIAELFNISEPYLFRILKAVGVTYRRNREG